jgi:hypothetical protein
MVNEIASLPKPEDIVTQDALDLLTAVAEP